MEHYEATVVLTGMGHVKAWVRGQKLEGVELESASGTGVCEWNWSL